ncbi:MAG: hypothetical protein ACTSPT_04525 [Candidatus Heimdallarchaeota archaeon]
MEKKKTLCFLLLSIALLMVGLQIVNVSTSVVQGVIANGANSSINPQPTYLTPNAINLTITTNPVEQYWFWINISVILVVTPLLIILPSVLIKDKNDEDSEIEEPKVISKEFGTVARFGWLTLFIQNILILVTYIMFFVLIPVYINSANFTLGQRILQTLFILFDVDFIAAGLLIAGLIILSTKLQKGKPFAYIAAGSWLVFIGVAIYPRISLVTDFSGGLGSTFNLEGFLEFLLNFGGVHTFLLTLSHCFFAIAILYTTRFLLANSQIKGKGMINAFGLINYIVGGLMNIALLSFLCMGSQMTGVLVLSILILYVILFGIKFGALPIIGIIAGMVGFSQMNPNKTD